MSTHHWPWWLGALALAGVAVAHVVTLGRPLGVSGLLERVVRRSGDRLSSVLFLGGLVLGGLVAALTGGEAEAGAVAPMGSVHVAALEGGLPRWGLLLGGSVLVGLGTALAGGCTSGHGLVGCARLQPGSLVTTAAFFGTAVALSLGLAAIVGVQP